MSEKPSQTKQILDLLHSMNERLARIETKVEMQPRIDSQRFENLERAEITCKQNYDQRIGEIAQQVEELKAKPGKRWDTVVGGMISALIGAIVGYFIKQ